MKCLILDKAGFVLGPEGRTGSARPAVRSPERPATRFGTKCSMVHRDMTAEHVRYHAAERPEAVAVIADGRTISFAELNRDIGKVMGALCGLGVRPGGSVAVGSDDRYTHFLLLLACERLGIAAASFARGEELACARLWASVDLVLAEPEIKVSGARQHRVLTPGWIEEIRAGDPGDEVAPPKHPDDSVRIVRTSGTTGSSKRFLVTRRMSDAMTAQWEWGFRLTSECRYLQTLPFPVRATFDLGSACLRAGGTVVFESRMRPIDAILAHAITHVILLPINLKAALDQSPTDFVKPRDLTVVSFGATLPDAVRERVMARIASSICDLYGTVEVSIVSAVWRLGADGFGTVWPSARAEVVDERGVPLPPGEMGRVRVKTDYMSVSYLDDPETTARMFRDGWFYPGDFGTVSADGRLKILGRVDDLLNIGGKKFLPATVEAALMRQEVAGDVGASSLPNDDGMEELCIGIAEVRLDDTEVMARIMRALEAVRVGRFHAVKLERIPRSANGKLQRQALRQEIARALRRPS